jgi:hypothetical protein
MIGCGDLIRVVKLIDVTPAVHVGTEIVGELGIVVGIDDDQAQSMRQAGIDLTIRMVSVTPSMDVREWFGTIEDDRLFLRSDEVELILSRFDLWVHDGL